ncbi:DUF6950 family protein [Sphingomonas parapaucimobilis]|uniref:DUF6950 domain-containing protein n=1 Tax=Sphingomonas parapaucimobilis NBRC 15100 TaxID=1219049 RepID=A0A0A1W5Y8_9SPHN|nr:hypothetical protein [Sphingomonas parapaucimobilis]GAM00571.1 hypothetical protein SP5_034_01460 [Sphingomonas parapaucimobilis NBRC 15100]
MYRKPDWEARLAAYLEPLRLRPFGPWGTYDCCVFTDGGIVAMTDTSLMGEFVGRYSTPIGAARVLKRYGAGTLEATIDRKLEPIPAALAQRGDVVMSHGLLGICWTDFMFAVGSEGEREGLIRIERWSWGDPRAWRVPYGA